MSDDRSRAAQRDSSAAHTMKLGPAGDASASAARPAQPRSDGRDEGGDPACWAHLFEDADEPEEGAAQDPVLQQK